MKIAIIGGGISGLTAAYHLNRDNEIKVFEARERLGGHTHTVDIETAAGKFAIDTGFIVFNDRTYPNFLRLMNEIGVTYQDTDMSFSVRNDSANLEYRGADLNGFFAQRRNLLRRPVYRILFDLIRFNRLAREQLQSHSEVDTTVAAFFQENRFSDDFIQNYFLPMGSAIWSCPNSTFSNFPIRFVMEFYSNHGLLSVADRPQWHVIQGGSSRYLEPLCQPFQNRIQTGTPVQRVEPTSEGVRVYSPECEIFDHVVFACHADQALRMLAQSATPSHRQVLSAFPYEKNDVILHTDESILPRSRRAWACWNYRIPKGRDDSRATVSYYMNQLQSLKSETPFIVSLNSQDLIQPDKILRRFIYEHPIFSLDRSRMQQRHSEINNRNGLSFCGAYWGNGFHEDGVKSALEVVASLRNRPSLSSATNDLFATEVS